MGNKTGKVEKAEDNEEREEVDPRSTAAAGHLSPGREQRQQALCLHIPLDTVGTPVGR